MKELIKVAWRGVRVSVALGMGAFLASLLERPELLWLAPVLNAIFKAIRDAFPKLWWIPL
jgi:hypothetical protein